MLALIQKSDLVGRGTSDSVCCSCSGIHIAYIAMERTHISFRTTAMSSPVLPLFIFMVHVTCSSKLRAQSPNTRFRFFFLRAFLKRLGADPQHQDAGGKRSSRVMGLLTSDIKLSGVGYVCVDVQNNAH